MTNDWKRELAEIVERAVFGNYGVPGENVNGRRLAIELRKAAEEKPAQCRCTLPKFKPWIHVDCKPAAAPQPERPSAEDWKHVAWTFDHLDAKCPAHDGAIEAHNSINPAIRSQAARLASGEEVIVSADSVVWVPSALQWEALAHSERDRDKAIEERDVARAQLAEARVLLNSWVSDDSNFPLLRESLDFLKRTTPSAGEGK